MADAHFEIRRLAELYDHLEPDRSDLGVYTSIVDELGATRVLDIGCGTGTFACMLASRGKDVIGLDPAGASLDVARKKPGADRFAWVHGDLGALPALQVDLATMTGNVAQVFVTDDEWSTTLRACHRTLRPGGHLVFETRVPEDLAWLRWTREATYTRSVLVGVGLVDYWVEVTDVRREIVSFRSTYIFETAGATYTSDSTLRFRSRAQIERSLEEADFAVRDVREAPDRPGREFVLISQRADRRRPTKSASKAATTWSAVEPLSCRDRQHGYLQQKVPPNFGVAVGPVGRCAMTAYREERADSVARGRSGLGGDRLERRGECAARAEPARSSRSVRAPTGCVMAGPLTSNAGPAADPNRWAVLALLGTAQLMVVLDATIVNIALPSAQNALHFSTADREWIVTAYALAFGSLLLLGGKLGDLFGRKWTFIAGLCGFAIVSAIGGLAQDFDTLVSARALQGVFGALLAPSALGLLTVTFAGSPDRAKAFGIFGAIAGGGASVGLVLGGALTQFLSWRWCLYVNLVIAVPTAIFALRLLVNHSDPGRARIDVPGLLTASAGLFALVYGFSNAETQSWTATSTIIALVAGPVLLITFAIIESRVKNPLLPLHIVRNRARGGAYISVLLASAGVFAVFFFLTYYMQLTLRFSPLTAGLAFLPMTGLLVATSVTAQTRVLPRSGAKPLVMTGMTLGTIAMIVFTRLTPGGAYATHVLPGLLIIGVAMGCIFAPAIGTATLGVEVRETGVASAMVNTSQQVGGAVGLALLSTVSASSVADYARTHIGLPGLAGAAAVHGYTTGFWWAAGIFAAGLFLTLLILPWKAEARECTPKTALARGIVYALHLEAAAAAAAAHTLRVGTRPPPRADS